MSFRMVSAIDMPGALPALTPEMVRGFALDRSISMIAQTITLSILSYEYLITFSDEVRYIWMHPLTIPSILFLINRYLTLSAIIIDSVMAFNNTIAQKVCTHWVRFQGSGAIAVVGLCEVIMIMRVYALYGGSKPLAAALGFILFIQIVVSAIVVNQGMPTQTPFECILVGGTDSSLFSVFWIAPLFTEACIFACTIWRSRLYMTLRRSQMPMMQLFLRDGCGYFGVVLLGNTANVIMFFTAQGSLKAFFAPLIQMMTSVMVSRLVLNLRGFLTDRDQEHSFGSGALDSHEMRVRGWQRAVRPKNTACDDMEALYPPPVVQPAAPLVYPPRISSLRHGLRPPWDVDSSGLVVYSDAQAQSPPRAQTPATDPAWV